MSWSNRVSSGRYESTVRLNGIVPAQSLRKYYHNMVSVRFFPFREQTPTKTRIVYCKDDDRRGDYSEIKFDFLGYTFRPRRSKNKHGKYFINFTPAVSNKAKKAMQQSIHDWRIHLKPDKTLEDLSRMFNPILRGWVNYYGGFYKSELYTVLRHMNRALVHWARRKYKKLARHRRRADQWLGRIARRETELFVHWKMGILPGAG